MDTFVEANLVSVRIGEFKSEMPSLDEIQEFYNLEKIDVASMSVPYCWSNTISSIDGIVSVGQGFKGVDLISLKNIPNSKSRTDFRLLSAGWAYCDAIIFSGASLRAEPNQKLLIASKELKQFRTNMLGKSGEQPDIVIVTSTGSIDVKHPVWKTLRRKLIATSRYGLVNLMQSLKVQLCDASSYSDLDVFSWLDENRITVKSFECPNGADLNVNLVDLSKFLKSQWNVNFVDVSAGPTLISLMIKSKVLHEYRYTMSGIVAGKSPVCVDGSVIHDGESRPDTFPASVNDYAIDESPLMEIVAIRLFGPFHVYHRCKCIYRH